MSRLAHLQSRFAPACDSSEDVAQRVLEAGEYGVAHSRKEKRKDDPVLLDLRVRNVARAVSDGDLAGRWELGAVIGAILCEPGR